MLLVLAGPQCFGLLFLGWRDAHSFMLRGLPMSSSLAEAGRQWRVFWAFQVKSSLVSMLGFFLGFLHGSVAIGHSQSTAMLMTGNSTQDCLGQACFIVDRPMVACGLLRRGQGSLSIVQVGN